MTAPPLEAPVTAMRPIADDPAEGTLGPERKRPWEQVALALFIGVPFLALVAAIPIAWGWGLGWRDVVIAVGMYAIAGHGITVGFHRYFTHGSFKAKRPLRIALAIAGSLAIEGPVIRWVSDHRKHHKFSDKEGDPHSPWRYGETVPALMKGLFYAHMGWLFDVEQTSQKQYAPDLLRDRDIVRVSALVPRARRRVAVSPRPHRRSVELVMARRGHRLLLGQPRPHRAAAPRDLVDQLHLPRRRREAVQDARPFRQRVVARRAVDGRVVAQPAPRRPDVRAPWGAARAGR